MGGIPVQQTFFFFEFGSMLKSSNDPLTAGKCVGDISLTIESPPCDGVMWRGSGRCFFYPSRGLAGAQTPGTGKDDIRTKNRRDNAGENKVAKVTSKITEFWWNHDCISWPKHHETTNMPSTKTTCLAGCAPLHVVYNSSCKTLVAVKIPRKNHEHLGFSPCSFKSQFTRRSG